MFLRCKVRRKDGKQHRYWSVVENTRVAGGRVVQRHVLYLGEINDTQELAWRRSIEVLEDGAARPRTLSLFPEDRVQGQLADASIVGVRLWQPATGLWINILRIHGIPRHTRPDHTDDETRPLR